MTEEEKLLLPAYLREAPENTGRVYGTLSYNRRSRCWTAARRCCCLRTIMM